MSTNRVEPLIETTYPGQPKATIVAPRHILEHYRKRPDLDLPFIQPVGRLKAVLDKYRADWQRYRAELKKNQDMLDRDLGIKR